MTPTIGSLFTGAGMLDVAVEQVFGAETIWHCENDPAAIKILTARWPGTTGRGIANLGDIRRTDFNRVTLPDILVGGFPCQDVSAGGRRAGLTHDNRSGLWSYMADAINALQPSLVVIENVRGLLHAAAHRNLEPDNNAMGNRTSRPVLRAAGAVLGDLADLGYDAQWATVTATSVGACHRRERVFIVAHPPGHRWRQRRPEHEGIIGRPHVALGGIEPVDVLPTPRASDRKGTDNETEWRRHSPGLAAMTHHLLPTPSAADGGGGGNIASQHAVDTNAFQIHLNSVSRLLLSPPPPEVNDPLVLLPTPEAKNSHAGQDYARADRPGSGGDDLVTAIIKNHDTQWGRYAPAIRRWEQITRPAPYPTEPNTRGNPRLNPAFAEWMMGWPPGWVTNIPGVSRNDQLKIIGNGVCPQQATAALTQLAAICEAAA